jgi:thiol:disulfide interchange protein
MKVITGFAILALGLGVVTCANKAKSTAGIEAVENETTGIQFRNISLADAKKAAKKEKKLIFIDVYAVWCGPCKMLDKNTFSDASVATYFNDKFISLKIDGDRNKQDGSWKHPDGKEVMETFGITAFPTLLWIDAEGKLVKKELGYKSPEQLLRAVQDIK